MTDTSGFDPSKHLMKVGRADYLPVQWRLVWLREVAPDAIVETELIDREPHVDSSGQVHPAATFKATVVIPNGGRATGYGDESANHFADYLTKAETKALGRALAALGFGTQFAGDMSEGERIADAPVKRAEAARPKAATAPTPIREAAPGPRTDGERVIASGHLRYINQEATAAGFSADEIESEIRRRFSKAPDEITMDEYRDLVEWLKAEQAKRAG